MVYTTADNLWILNASSKVFSRLSQRLSTASLSVLTFMLVLRSLKDTASVIIFSTADDERNDSFSKTIVSTLFSLLLLFADEEDLTRTFASSSSKPDMSCLVLLESSSIGNDDNTIILLVGVDDKCRVWQEIGWRNADEDATGADNNSVVQAKNRRLRLL
mmetsp:Transcript_6464/g.10866  ORF Transcript_6464/g.10866 Transcript_6464/m.10866 type:complete len:160 (-) Transcript_6464:199-678(-)